ncbi:oxygenase MpaB family protein [Kitasatospora sp. NPDC052896]|uniref:oxygenase MpaB family protein n=1 Tax=Kitasatospora sp. NPDC052896 TaxID=3364061 RepID=UPI0037C9FA18
MTGTTPDRSAYARLVLETMPQESRIGLTLGFVRTFGVPEIAEVLHATGRMTTEPWDRAKATGTAMFALIEHGPGSPEGRRIVDELRRVHDRPGITPELMHYVLACFTVCPLRFLADYAGRPATGAELAAARTFHHDLAAALTLPEPPAAELAGLAGWMSAFEDRRFAPSPAGRALWEATSGLLATRLPTPLAPLGPAVAAALLDQPLRTALGIRRPPAPIRALVSRALRARARQAAG